MGCPHRLRTVETHRLPVDAALRPDPVDAGWARVIRRGPRTIGEVLRSASDAMDEEDRLAAVAADPLAFVIAARRRCLWGRLMHGRR
jgi:hypothetical protein